MSKKQLIDKLTFVLFSRFNQEEATCSIKRNLVVLVKRNASSYIEKHLIGGEERRVCWSVMQLKLSVRVGWGGTRDATTRGDCVWK